MTLPAFCSHFTGFLRTPSDIENIYWSALSDCRLFRVPQSMNLPSQGFFVSSISMRRIKWDSYLFVLNGIRMGGSIVWWEPNKILQWQQPREMRQWLSKLIRHKSLLLGKLHTDHDLPVWFRHLFFSSWDFESIFLRQNMAQVSR